MPSTVLDTLTHGFSRRQSFSAPATAEDRKRKKKKNRNNGGKKKIFARCTSQIPACQTLAQQTCGDSATCLAAVTACCDQLNSCNFTGFVACFNSATAS